jgi:hypothetical protein
MSSLNVKDKCVTIEYVRHGEEAKHMHVSTINMSDELFDLGYIPQ